ncbi:hypothetical protein TNCV_2898541 [Trichonephila clavipes]|nr:hypothetical protein TNCV_2898541 [Trichonephila clavipes]
MEKDRSEIAAKLFHIVPHVTVRGITENVMNEALEQLSSFFDLLTLGNVAEQRDKGTKTNSFSQSSEKNQSFCDGNGKVNLIVLDEDFSEKISKKHHKEH